MWFLPVEKSPKLAGTVLGEPDGAIQEQQQPNSLLGSGLAPLVLGKCVFQDTELAGLSVSSIFKVLNSHIKCLVCFEEKRNLCNFFEKLWTLTFYTCNYDKSSQHKPATVSSK